MKTMELKNINFKLFRDAISNGVKGKIILKEPLKRHTSFKVGGPAKFFIRPFEIADLNFIITSAKRNKLPISIIGNGTNILASDKGIKAIVLQLNSFFFQRISAKRNYLQAGCGVPLRKLIQKAGEVSLSGLEFLVGIPGTVGGALIMNAGAWGKNIADFVENVLVMDYNGNIKILEESKIKFGYRKSSLDKFVILILLSSLRRVCAACSCRAHTSLHPRPGRPKDSK